MIHSYYAPPGARDEIELAAATSPPLCSLRGWTGCEGEGEGISRLYMRGASHVGGISYADGLHVLCTGWCSVCGGVLGQSPTLGVT